MKEPQEIATPVPITCKLIPELPFPWNGAYIQWEIDILQHALEIPRAEKNREPTETEPADGDDGP